jgi:hypothetical protein
MRRVGRRDYLIVDDCHPESAVRVKSGRARDRCHPTFLHKSTVTTESAGEPVPKLQHVLILLRRYPGRVDPQVDVIYGPRPVQKTGNVSVPRELLLEVGVVPGRDQIHWAMNPNLPGTLVLIPAAQVARAMDAIRQALGEHG